MRRTRRFERRNTTCRFACAALGVALLLPLTSPARAADQPLPSPGFTVVRERPDFARATRPYRSPYRGPIIDIHAHLFDRHGRLNIDDILDEMKAAGVVRLFVLPTPNEGRYQEADANAAARRQFVRQAGNHGGRLCGGTYFTAWMHTAYRNGYRKEALEERLQRLESDLAGGGCLGIGEIGPYHFEKHQGQDVLTIPMNFEPMLRLAQLAARRHVWLDLHAEPRTPDGESYEDRIFGGIAYLFAHAPGLQLILSHTGMTDARNARALLERYPRLMMDLKITAPGGDHGWDNLGPIVNEDGALFADWAALLDAMPDRFMIGIDARFGSGRFARGKYAKRVRHIRKLLGALEPAAAAMIAWRTAERLWPGAPIADITFVPASAGEVGKHKRHRHRRDADRKHGD